MVYDWILLRRDGESVALRPITFVLTRMVVEDEFEK